MRKAALAQLLADPVDGIFIAEYEQDGIGDVLFRVVCNMGLGGIGLETPRPRLFQVASVGAGECR
jgi:hypothetical protein